MSGRQAKVLREQADRYGIPFDGATIDLPKVVRALHDFLARNAHKLNQGEDDYLIGESSPALERYREERAKIAKLDRLQREGTLADVRELHDGLLRMASIIRSAGESLQRIYGPEAADLLNEAIDEAQEHLDEFFSDSQSSTATRTELQSLLTTARSRHDAQEVVRRGQAEVVHRPGTPAPLQSALGGEQRPSVR